MPCTVAQTRIKCFKKQHQGDTNNHDQNFIITWNNTPPEPLIDVSKVNFDKSILSKLSSRSLCCLALLTRPGLLVENGKLPGNSSTSGTCCQPDYSAKQFYATSELESVRSSPLELEGAPITCVAYKAVKVNEGEGNTSPIRPMIFPNIKCHEEILQKNYMAVKAEEKDFKNSLQLLFPECNQDVVDDGGGDNLGSLELFLILLIQVDLSTTKGWIRLIKTLDKHLPDKISSTTCMPHGLNDTNLRWVASSLFTTKINFNLAFLSGEAAVLDLKLRQLAIDRTFAHLDSDNKEGLCTSFTLLQNDYDLEPQKLKRHSHDQRTLIASSSQSGSLKDLMMETALETIQKPISTIVASAGEKMDQAAYTNCLLKNQERALDFLIDSKYHNPHVQSIIESYMKKYDKSATEFPRRHFLDAMSKNIFNPSFYKHTPKAMGCIICLLTQFDDPKSAEALLSLLCKDEEVIIFVLSIALVTILTGSFVLHSFLVWLPPVQVAAIRACKKLAFGLFNLFHLLV